MDSSESSVIFTGARSCKEHAPCDTPVVSIPAMHPRLEELSALLARARDDLLKAVHEVPDDQRERRPPDGDWSVAEVVDHLRAVEAGSAALLARRALRAREAGIGPDPETSSVLGRLDHADLVDTPVRRVAPDIVRPREGTTTQDALDGLTASRAALGDAVRALDGLDATQVKATHAALGELDAYQWLLFIAQHELRHARQIRMIALALREE